MQDFIINEATAKILEDYMELTGNMCSPSITDYLAIRETAVRELKSGILFSTQVQSQKSLDISKNVRKSNSFADGYQNQGGSTEPQIATTEGESTQKINAEKKNTSKVSASTVNPKNDVKVQKEEKPKSDFEILRALKDEWN